MRGITLKLRVMLGGSAMWKLMMVSSRVLAVLLLMAAFAPTVDCAGSPTPGRTSQVRAPNCCDTHHCCTHHANKNCGHFLKAPADKAFVLSETLKVFSAAGITLAAQSAFRESAKTFRAHFLAHPELSPPSFNPVLRI